MVINYKYLVMWVVRKYHTPKSSGLHFEGIPSFQTNPYPEKCLQYVFFNTFKHRYIHHINPNCSIIICSSFPWFGGPTCFSFRFLGYVTPAASAVQPSVTTQRNAHRDVCQYQQYASSATKLVGNGSDPTGCGPRL